MLGVQFLSDDWLAAMDAAARARVAPDDDPLASVTVAIEQAITDGPRWRLLVADGHLSVVDGTDADDEPEVRLTCDRATAAAIATGQRSALDAFIAGDLVLGGDARVLLANRAALEAVGDLFAQVRSDTTFP